MNYFLDYLFLKPSYSSIMASITKRYIRPILSHYHSINQQRRCTVTITDEYRPTTKSRSSIKGLELLRNPSLNKVNEREMFNISSFCY
jgi:hypothetical protein